MEKDYEEMMEEFDDMDADIEAKKALIEEAKQIDESQDWNAVSRTINDLKRRWKKIHYSDSVYEDQLRDEFEGIIDKFYAKRDELYDENKKLKEQLIEKAKEVSESDQWKEATETVKDLMEEWKKIGTAGRQTDDELWDRFNEARQKFYDRKHDHWKAMNDRFSEVKDIKKDLIEKVKSALTDAAGVEVRPVPDVYPMGWERVLVREILHKEYGMLPAEAGAIVDNATTAIAMARAFRLGEPIVRKTITVSGDGVKNPMNVSVPVGMPVNEIIEACGGYTCDSVRLIAGGPMMGKTILNDQFVIDRAMNALTILKHVEDDAIECLRCGRCSDHCPSGLQPVRIAAAVKANDVDEMIKRGASSCIECGLCTYVCPSHINVTENVRKAKRVIALKKK